MLASVLFVSLLAPAVDSDVLWAGHHVTLGRRRVPFRGEQETRTDTWVLAKLRSRDDGGVDVVQRTCAVKFKRVAGVQVSIDGASLPVSTLRLRPAGDGDVLEGGSVVKWGDEDVDDDGYPGMTVRVRARVCSGDLHVANRSVTRARARMVDGVLYGTASVRVTQSILGAEGACLSVVASDTDEQQRGSFAFKPVPVDATCESLAAGTWPVAAP